MSHAAARFFQILLFGILFFGNSASLFSQNFTTKKTVEGKAKAAFGDAMKCVNENNYAKALPYFSKAVKADSTFIDGFIWLGGCETQLGHLPEAEGAFKKALQIDANYEPLVEYNLAKLAQEQGHFADQTAHAEQFLKLKKGSAKARNEAGRLVQNGLFAEKAMQKPVPFDLRPLPSTINTEAHEFLPSFTADGQTMLFSRRGKGQFDDENLYFSQKIDSVWQKAMPMTDINTAENEGLQSITADGNQIFFTACGRKETGLGSCDIYFTQRKPDGSWSRVKNVGEPISTRFWDSGPSISADGSTLFFSSDRPGETCGKRDIWFATRLLNGGWSEPTNLGPTVNSRGDDEAPFIHPDGKTLYFRSDSLPGMGGFDIFVSRKQADGTWGKPQNLGYPINTPAYEGALTVSLDGRTAYFSSEREGGQGLNDIYSFELPEAARAEPMTYVKARVRDYETARPLVAKTDFVDLANGKNWLSGSTQADGSFLVCLPVGKNFALEVSKMGYAFHSENFNLTEAATADKPFLLEILLEKLKETTAAPTTALSKPIVLKNIFFETGSAVLKTESTSELLRLRDFLTENPTVKIQLSGHTDNVGDEAANLILSENRARAVFDFLTKNGIAAARLAAKGFGETQPIESNDTPEGRAANRRTEFQILN